MICDPQGHFSQSRGVCHDRPALRSLSEAKGVSAFLQRARITNPTTIATGARTRHRCGQNELPNCSTHGLILPLLFPATRQPFLIFPSLLPPTRIQPHPPCKASAACSPLALSPWYSVSCPPLRPSPACAPPARSHRRPRRQFAHRETPDPFEQYAIVVRDRFDPVV